MTRRASAAAAALAVVAALAAVLVACGGRSPQRPRRPAPASAGSNPASHASAPDPRAAFSMPTLLPTARPTGVPVRVTVASRASGPGVPADFLGLSFELRSLPAIAGYAGRGNLVALLRSLGPGVLRFGGVSADERAAWVAGGSASARAELPGWAGTAITTRDLGALAVLARETGWRVLLTVDLGHYDPAAAGQEAAAAFTALGPALAGIEIGNEPDRYVRRGLRGPGWDFAAYRAQAAAYRAAIAAAAPGVALAGPDPSSGLPGLAWLRAAARTLHLQLLTDHYYPLSSCGYRPNVGELLSPSVRAKDDAMLARLLAIARAAATPLRADEVGSVSCEGFPGVSDTFASALWALDYAAHAASAGIAGLNFHDLLAKPAAYSPLVAPTPAALAAGALRAQPDWYALLAARELAGSRALPASVTGGRVDELDASAFRAPDGRLRLVLVDYDPPGARPLDVRLQAPPATGGSILRLTGPSPAATAGVRLGGRAVAPDGAWSAPAALPAVYTRHRALSVQLSASSAAIVTLYPRQRDARISYSHARSYNRP